MIRTKKYLAIFFALTLGINQPIFNIPLLANEITETDDSDNTYLDKPKEHKHIWKEIERTEATCQQEGMIKYECEDCKEQYEEIIEKTEHKYKTEVVQPTYTEKGYTKNTCTVCKDSFIDNEVATKTLPKIKNLKSTVTEDKITLTWNTINGFKYEVQLKVNETYKTNQTVSKSKAIISKLKSGTEYNIRIRPLIGDKKGEWYYISNTTKLSKPTIKAKPGKETITVSWNKVTGATAYRVWVKSVTDKKFAVKRTLKNTATSTTFKNLAGNKPYQYYIEAIRKINNKTTYSAKSNTVKTKAQCKTYLFKVVKGSNLIWQSSRQRAWYAHCNEYYTGYYSFNYRGKICLYFRNKVVLIPYNNVKKVSNTKILSGSVNNQCWGQIYGGAACGPAALWTLLHFENNYKGSKDDLIRYAETHSIKGMGNMRNPNIYNAGCYTYSLVQMTNMLTNGKYQLKNVYSSKKKPTTSIIEQINQNKRCIINCSYEGWGHKLATYRSGTTHFIVVIGYEKHKTGTWFYYLDPLDADTVKRVSTTTLNNAIYNMPKNEPRGILCKK